MAQPTDYRITWDFKGHVAGGSSTPGIDFGTPMNTPLAPLKKPGKIKILFVGEDSKSINPRDGSRAKYIMAEDDKGARWFYVHLSKITCVVGQTLDPDLDIIGLSGDSGNTSGPHTHVGKRVGNVYVDFQNDLGNNDEMNPLIIKMLGKPSDATKHLYLWNRRTDGEFTTELLQRAGMKWKNDAEFKDLVTWVEAINELPANTLNDLIGDAQKLGISLPVLVAEGLPSPIQTIEVLQKTVGELEEGLVKKTNMINDLKQDLDDALQNSEKVDDITYEVIIDGSDKTYQFKNMQDAWIKLDALYKTLLANQTIRVFAINNTHNFTKELFSTTKLVETKKTWIQKVLDLIFNK